MTVTVSIHVQEGVNEFDRVVVVNDAAEEAIRFSFNPSGLPSVTSLKAIAAAFLTLCDAVREQVPNAGRELSVAKTNMQTASMWSVLGATKAPAPAGELA